MTSTATEVRIKERMFWERVTPALVRVNETMGELLAKSFAMANRRRRGSKGWRKHVRRMKSKTRGI